MLTNMRSITLAILATIGPVTLASAQGRSSGSLADKSWFTYGPGVGFSGISVIPTATTPELVCGGGMDNQTISAGNRYWLSTQWDSTAGEYKQVFASPIYSDGERIRRLRSAELDATNPGPEIILALENGVVEIWSHRQKTLLSTYSTPAKMPNGLEIADLEGNGQVQLVLVDDLGLYVLSHTGSLLWSSPTFTGKDVTVGQFDRDPALEIVTTSGHVVDALTRKAQWIWHNGFGIDMAAADIDADGIDELIAAEKGDWVWAFDIDRQVPKWSTYVRTPETVSAADVDGNGSIEVLIGETNWGRVLIHEGSSGGLLRGINHPLSGITNLASGDLDGDGQIELIWGEGHTSTGKDQLTIADPVSLKIEYESEDVGPMFFGPFPIDIDKNGQEEILVIASASDAGYKGSRVIIFDPITLEKTNMLPPMKSGGSSRYPAMVKRLDANGDGYADLIMAADAVELLEYDSLSGTFKVTKSAQKSGRNYIADFDFADLDGDQSLEVVCAVGDTVEVLDWGKGSTTWTSPSLGGTILQVLSMNSDLDPQLEIHALDRSGKLHIIDGLTHVITSLSPPQQSYTRLANAGSRSRGMLVAGDAGGGITALLPGTYSPLGPVPLRSGSIEFLEFTPGSPFIIAGSQSSLSIHLGITPAWQSGSYGVYLGNHVLLWGSRPMLLNVNSHGFVGFNL